mmetsp:Transcript_16251/g.37461  ORF Transcript_16251/g.37461 Transcript_16251/m.37461 type:complete len:245 (+) Transcript_16251:128-862(+)
MALRAEFEGSSEVGVYARLTNSYCLAPLGRSPLFHSTLEEQFSKHIPVLASSIGGTQIVGRVAVGNRYGLAVPNITTDQELQHLRNNLPDGVKVQKLQERMSALGNCIACNDYVALVHADLDVETCEVLEDCLQVEVFRGVVADQVLVGSYLVLTNQGGLVHPGCKASEMEELSQMLDLPLSPGTINRGSSVVGAGLLVNDWSAVCGMSTSAIEVGQVESIFKLSSHDDITFGKLSKGLVESIY